MLLSRVRLQTPHLQDRTFPSATACRSTLPRERFSPMAHMRPHGRPWTRLLTGAKQTHARQPPACYRARSRRCRGKARTVAVKYRNPKNADEVWSGRGRMPLWLGAEIKAGKARDDFLVA
jgi:H-NS histone C-terminal domain